MSAALQQASTYNQRLALSAIEDRLNGLLRELARSSDRYAVRFRPIAIHWWQVIAVHVQVLAEAVEQRQEIESPYVIGVPLTAQQAIFVGRTDISVHIEGMLRDRQCPPLLLYGQRCMGKTSLLNNLGRMLPSTIVPLFVDLQGPVSQAADHAGLLAMLARAMSSAARRQRVLALPSLERQNLAADPFPCFDEWLDRVEQVLADRTALLMLDEFEALDGHPALVQLLCAEIIGLKNTQPPALRRLVEIEDVEAAVPEALRRGSFFFADIQRNQVDATGLAVLRYLAVQGQATPVERAALARQFPQCLDQALALLARRELIEAVDGGYRFQVELIRRWFAQP